MRLALINSVVSGLTFAKEIPTSSISASIWNEAVKSRLEYKVQKDWKAKVVLFFFLLQFTSPLVRTGGLQVSVIRFFRAEREEGASSKAMAEALGSDRSGHPVLRVGTEELSHSGDSKYKNDDDDESNDDDAAKNSDNDDPPAIAFGGVHAENNA